MASRGEERRSRDREIKKVIPIDFGMTFMFRAALVGFGGRHHLGAQPPDRPGDGVPPPKLSFLHDPALLSRLALSGRGYSG